MERGMVISIHNNGGTISRPGSVDVSFHADRILPRDRASLKQGDQVWFEVQSAGGELTAINIRKNH